MKIGWGLPNFGHLGTRDNMLTLAKEAEKLGYDSLWAGERLLYPTNPKQLQRGGPWPDAYRRSLSTLETLVFAAAVTDKIRLGTSTLNLAFHNPANLAKEIATLDVLSNGRTIIGAGQGWSEDEFLASGVPFDERTGRMIEVMKVLNALWGPDPVEFKGKYYEVPPTNFNPKPIQQPRPPILIAAFAPAAIARAAKLADGFNPIAGPDAAANEQTLKAELAAWKEAGREPAKPIIAMRVNHGFISEKPITENRQFLTGTVEQVRDDVKQLEAWGATEIFFAGARAGMGQPDEFKIQVEQLNKLRGVVA